MPNKKILPRILGLEKNSGENLFIGHQHIYLAILSTGAILLQGSGSVTSNPSAV